MDLGLDLLPGRFSRLEFVARFVKRLHIDRPILHELGDTLVLGLKKIIVRLGALAARLRFGHQGLRRLQICCGGFKGALFLFQLRLGLHDQRLFLPEFVFHLRNPELHQAVPLLDARIHVHADLGDVAGDHPRYRRAASAFSNASTWPEAVR